MADSCMRIIVAIVVVALAFVSLPSLAIVAAGALAIWFLRGGTPKADAADAARERDAIDAIDPDDDTLSVDSGVLSAQDFRMGVSKADLKRPHTQPPQPPAAEISAFRVLKATDADGNDRSSPLYESHLTAKQFEESLNRGQNPDLRHHYTEGRSRHMRALQKEVPLKDPNLIPLDPKEPVGCPHPLGKL